ncbi:S8 family peptidase [bacterium]|nr:S8 family peptidase [bacterium]
MRFVIFLIVLGLAFSFSFSGEYGWMPHQFLVLFYPEPNIEFSQSDGGQISCGIAKIDSLIQYFGVYRAKKLFPIVPNENVNRANYNVRNQFLFYADVDSSLIPSVCRAFERCQYVIFSDPDYLHPVCKIPDDPGYRHQWFHNKIDAPFAWNYATGSHSIKVSVIEGVEWYHPDLYDNIWVNPGEDLDSDGVPFDPDDINGVDDDGNGYVDDFIGWDFVDVPEVEVMPGEDGVDEDNDPDDFDGHGTHCSGALAAVGNNGIGVAGVCWQADIVCLRTDIAPAVGTPYHISSAVISALGYARSLSPPIEVLNFSYGDTFYSNSERYSLQQCWDAGIVMLGAAGNDGVSTRHYPSGYNTVIGVAATDHYDYKADFSNYGSWVSVSAPGVSIYSTVVGSTYISYDGTSMATPVASGVAALLRYVYPDSSNEWIRERVEQGTDNIDDLNPEYIGLIGTGRVNAFKSLYQWIFPYLDLDTFYIEDTDGDGRVVQGEQGQLFLYFVNDPEWQPAEDITITVSSDDTAIQFIDSVCALGSIAPGDSGNNESDPITFRMNPHQDYGHPVEIVVTLESGSSDFMMDYHIKFMLGYAPILFYDCDGGDSYDNYITTTLDRGAVVYDYWDRSERGIIDSALATDFFKIFIISTGNDSVNLLFDEEISLFEYLADIGKSLILTGQYLPDTLGVRAPEFLSDYFGAIHNEDLVLRMWGSDIRGVDDDPISISSTTRFNAWSSSDAAGNQVSFGTANPTGSGVGFMRYNMDANPDNFAAIRDSLSSGAKTVLFEVGLEGLTNGAPGYECRDTLIANMIRWLGFQYTADVEEHNELEEKPDILKLFAFPNPFNSAISISFKSNGWFSANVFDFSGRLVKSLGSGTRVGDVSLKWDGRDFVGRDVPAGMYLVEVKAKGKAAVTKVILAR